MPDAKAPNDIRKNNATPARRSISVPNPGIPNSSRYSWEKIV